MFKSYKTYAALAAILFLALFTTSQTDHKQASLPLIAIANYGPHSSLQETIDGMKAELTKLGYIENTNIRYEIADVNFETSLIIQMLNKLKSSKPDILVTLSTPIAQSAKNMIKDIPVIFTDVTDPDEAGLITNDPNSNITGASDKQDLTPMLQFAKQLLPKARTVGVLYSTGEANDISMLNMLKKSASSLEIDVIAIPIEHTRDVITRMKLFKNKVDFIYTGSSGAIQAALPAIVSIAESMKLPLFNFNSEEVIEHNALASFGVSHKQVGANAAHIIHRIFQGEKPGNIAIIHPSNADHAGFISSKRAKRIGIDIPKGLAGITIID
ncbi:MAG: ABC transporter substrate-binding protein [Rickettsiaceae bacterium]|nr:ABC transporter substrate-binding protein [Rickettsiaceae bacterium]MDP5020466.1 ABC transporter substrate-binding protein [Rickettsiaceae bacterium]